MDWAFEGYITSDSGACNLIDTAHHYANDTTHAAADCLTGPFFFILESIVWSMFFILVCFLICFDREGGTDINSGTVYLLRGMYMSRKSFYPPLFWIHL